MSRDHRRLRVFQAADHLVEDVYRITQPWPALERFGLQTQIRRAAVSVAANIVEGSARRTTREYVSFLNVAAGSAAEVSYLITLAGRLGLLTKQDGDRVGVLYGQLVAQLQSLIKSLSREP